MVSVSGTLAHRGVAPPEPRRVWFELPFDAESSLASFGSRGHLLDLALGSPSRFMQSADDRDEISASDAEDGVGPDGKLRLQISVSGGESVR